VSAPRRIAALALTIALAAGPATAFAQSGAGDEQYSDPFAAPSAPAKPKPQAAPTQAAPAPAQAAPATTQSSAPSTATVPAPAATATAAQLPRTGFDVLPLALVGVALIGAGLVLLRRRGAHAGD
jgi:LPXTG-motif cell wall-anchored protein